MYLPELIPELIDQIFTALLELIGPVKILRLRTVNHISDEWILRAVLHSYISCRQGPFHYWLDQWIQPPENRSKIRWYNYRRVAPPMMSRFIEARLKFDDVEVPLQILRESLGVMDEMCSVSQTQARQRALKVYEAASNFLDWGVDHKFASSWPGDNPRMECEVDEKKQNLLGVAIIIGEIATVRLLLGDAALNSNYESPVFGRPLQLAARWGQAEIVDVLLHHDANPLASQVHKLYGGPPEDYVHGKVWGSFYSTHGNAIQVAALAGHTSILHSLLKVHKDLPYFDASCYNVALSPASRGGSVDAVKMLMKTIPHVGQKAKNSTFLAACRQGRLSIIKLMIKKGAQPHTFAPPLRNIVPRTGLEFAALRGSYDIVQFLLEGAPYLCNLNTMKFRSERAMYYALINGHVDCAKLLQTEDLRHSFSWLIHRACPHVRSFRLLVSLRFNLNEFQTGKHITIGTDSLLRSIESHNEPVARALLEMGVLPNKGDEHFSPVLWAKICDSFDVLKTLLEFGGTDLDLESRMSAADIAAERMLYQRKSRAGYIKSVDGSPKGWRDRDF